MNGNVVEAPNRLLSLDAFRGLAVLLMILSGSIAFGGALPAWMYHAQVPPPTHVFNPAVNGITWVDLVFPFFLFSMGAAFPLALAKKSAQQGLVISILYIIKRYILLIFFAVFTYHSRAWVLSESPANYENLISISCFLLLFLMFSKMNFKNLRLRWSLQIFGFLVSLFFLWQYPFIKGGFDINKSDIIIIVLANMALFGSIIWLFTKNNPWLRVAVLPIVMAIFLSSKTSNSIASDIFNWSSMPWAYTFYYLKYLFIIIPGTFAGDWLLKISTNPINIKPSIKTISIVAICLTLVVLNTIFLFNRQLVLNIYITIILSVLLILLSKKAGSNQPYQQFVYLGIFLLVLGLFFEPYEGGIKKDPSNYSYYFVCSGMAFLTILSFIILEATCYFKTSLKLIAKVGQNPMIAYTAGNLFLLPILRITDTEIVLNQLNQTLMGGFLRGLIFTSIVAAITIYFTNKRVFWKT